MYTFNCFCIFIAFHNRESVIKVRLKINWLFSNKNFWWGPD